MRRRAARFVQTGIGLVTLCIGGSLVTHGLLSMTGCARDTTAYPAFKAYVDATAAPFEQYVNNDTSLDAAQRTRRLQAVESARRYVHEAGK
ncbi:MAG: hypothetical protein KF768_13485 [Phycisphaeraceae bacterium]|nr:hypothetical protein [Phycisphaeraceae bacterium]